MHETFADASVDVSAALARAVRELTPEQAAEFDAAQRGCPCSASVAAVCSFLASAAYPQDVQRSALLFACMLAQPDRESAPDADGCVFVSAFASMLRLALGRHWDVMQAQTGAFERCFVSAFPELAGALCAAFPAVFEDAEAEYTLPDVMSAAIYEPLSARARRFWRQHTGCGPVRRLLWREARNFALQEDVRPAVSRKLLTLCLGACDAFSFTAQPGGSEKLRRLLRPFLVTTFDTARWFCYRVPQTQPLHVLLYRLDTQSARLLQLFCEDLFLHYAERGSGYAQDLEDLCFFRSGTLVLGTVSHERICQAFAPDAAFAQALLRACGQFRPLSAAEERLRLDTFSSSSSGR